MTTPTTAAGRAYVGDGGTPKFRERRLYHTLRIEAEARAAALEDIAKLRTAAQLVVDHWYGPEPEYGLWAVLKVDLATLREALAAIDALRERSGE